MDKEKIYGYTSAELFPFRGKVKWRGEKAKYRHERYVERALKDIEIPADTAIVFTDEKRTAYDCAEIAPANENGEDFFVIFIHNFSVAEIEHSIERLSEFFPYFSLNRAEKEKFVTAFLQKVIWHELGHRKAWLEKGFFASKEDEEKGILLDTEEEAEFYAWKMVEQKYGTDFEHRLRIVNFSVFMSMILSEGEAKRKEIERKLKAIQKKEKRKRELAEKIDKKMREGVSFEEFVKLHREVLKEV